MDNIKINNYNKTTLSKFDIIGSYFVGVYYNDLYKKAEHLFLEDKYNNLTESYKSILYNYIKFTKTNKFFTKTVIGIHKYFINSTRFTQITYKECIDFIVSEFIPNELFNSVKETKKYKLLNEILINCLEIFTEDILLNHIIKIIDNHSEESNCLLLQNVFLKIILLEKDKMYAKFINPNQKNHTIPIELFNNIQKKLIKSSQINKQLLFKYNELNKSIQDNLSEKNNYTKEIIKLQDNIKYLLSYNKQLEYKLNKIQSIPTSTESIPTSISISTEPIPTSTSTSTESIPKSISTSTEPIPTSTESTSTAIEPYINNNLLPNQQINKNIITKIKTEQDNTKIRQVNDLFLTNTNEIDEYDIDINYNNSSSIIDKFT